MDAIDYLVNRFGFDRTARPPIQIPMQREEMPAMFCDLNMNLGVEVGVETGLFSECLLKANPNLHLFSVDAWTAYKGYRDHVSQAKLDGFYEEAKTRLKPYNCTIMRMMSVEAAKEFRDGWLDFVYIDGNHEFLQVTQDIAAWTPKLRTGGILCGHDFKRDKGRDWVCHVKDVVQAWAYSHQIAPWFVLRGHGNPNWLWVKT